MFTLFPLKQTEVAFSHTVGNIHHAWSPWHLANGGGGCPQIPCNKNPLQWHWPWILNGTVHHKRKRDGNYVSSVKNLREASRCSCHCCHWKPSWYQCHIVWEYWSANCAEVCCCYWRCSFCFPPGTFTNGIQEAFWEPRLVTDPRVDHQPLTMSYFNLPPAYHRSVWHRHSSLLCGLYCPLRP